MRLLVGEASLGGRDANRTRLDPNGFAKRARERLEAYLDDMVQDLAAVEHDMQVALSAPREGFEKYGSELHVPRPELRPPRKRDLPNEVRSSGEIERAGGSRFVHRQRR